MSSTIEDQTRADCAKLSTSELVAWYLKPSMCFICDYGGPCRCGIKVGILNERLNVDRNATQEETLRALESHGYSTSESKTSRSMEA